MEFVWTSLSCFRDDLSSTIDWLVVTTFPDLSLICALHLILASSSENLIRFLMQESRAFQYWYVRPANWKDLNNGICDIWHLHTFLRMNIRFIPRLGQFIIPAMPRIMIDLVVIMDSIFLFFFIVVYNYDVIIVTSVLQFMLLLTWGFRRLVQSCDYDYIFSLHTLRAIKTFPLAFFNVKSKSEATFESRSEDNIKNRS